jgi:tetratricopeptide (TPR) repeat protein
MLFDLSSGKRRRAVQVVYATLALLLGGGLVLFGIGGSQGGILDALGIGGGDSGSSNPQYDQQISDDEAKLKENPNDTAALIDLLRTHYLSATSTGVTTDQATGQVSISEDAHAELEQAAEAWERYLKTKPDRPNTGAAVNAVQVYQLLGDAGGAAAAQKIVAEAQGTSAAYGQLAFYLYADLKFEEADAAAKKAVDLADPANQKTLEKTLAAYSERAHQQQKLIKQQQQQQQQGGAQAGQQQLSDPFGALGATPSGAAPATTTP